MPTRKRLEASASALAARAARETVAYSEGLRPGEAAAVVEGDPGRQDRQWPIDREETRRALNVVQPQTYYPARIGDR
jgi:hypothetical protein